MAINFPPNATDPNPPSDGDTYVDAAGTEWVYDSTNNSWTISDNGASLDERYVKLDGDDTNVQTITGDAGLKTEGLLESAGGVKISGGTEAVVNGIYAVDGPDDSLNFVVGGQTKADLNSNLFRIFKFGTISPAFIAESQYVSINTKNTTLNNSTLSLKVEIDKADLPSHNVCLINQPKYTNIADGATLKGVSYSNPVVTTSATGVTNYAFSVNNFTDRFETNIGYYSQIGSGNNINYTMYHLGSAPSFLAGDTYIGGNVARNTFDLWKSTLTEEQLEQLEAGTLVAPANVGTPGDGSFARQWYYDQQDAETQALLDSGELEYPEHLAAATFTDTFDLGDNTKINLLSSGKVELIHLPVSNGRINPTIHFNKTDSANGNDTGIYGTNTGQIRIVGGDGTVNETDRDLARFGQAGIRFLAQNASASCYSLDGTITSVTGGGNANGVIVKPDISSDCPGLFRGINSSGTLTAAVNVADYAFYDAAPISINVNPGSTIGNVYAYYATGSTSTSTLNATNSYSFYTSLDSGTGNNYGFYAAGTAPNYFKGDVMVGDGNSRGVVLTSPNGTKYRLVVADDGSLSTTAV